MAELPQLNVNYGSYMPKSYSADLFKNVTAFDEQQQKEQQRQFMEGINAMGKTFTGSSLRSGINTLLGPQNQRTQHLLNQIAIQGAQTGAQEQETLQAQGYQSKEAGLSREWQTRENEKTRALQEEELKMKRAEARKAGRFGNILSRGLSTAVGGMVAGAPGAIFGGLQSWLGGAGEVAGSMPDMSSAYPGTGLDAYSYTPKSLPRIGGPNRMSF